MSLQHDENNENIISKSKREKTRLGKIASAKILVKLNSTLNQVYSILKKNFNK